MDLVDLISAAHQAARSGRIDAARELLQPVRPYGAKNADIARALAMLDILLGDAPLDARTIPDEDVSAVSVEDGLEHELPHVVSQQHARRLAHAETERLSRGDFGGAGRAFFRIANACSPVQLGARLLKTRAKMLPRWSGGRVGHLAVVCAAGHGDVCLFGRYLDALRSRAERITVIVHAPLVSLLRDSLPGMAVVAHQDCAAAFAAADAYVDHVLAPFVLGARYGAAGWLRADAAKYEGPGPHIGICWNGGMGNPDDSLRSVPVEQLAPLFELPGITWHSLQVGPKAAECPAHVVNHADGIRDFRDTARLIAGLDLVVSVDTAVANLAGAMGRPVHVLVEEKNEWRWGRRGELTPWYPTARVFRQEKAGEWAAVVERLKAGLTN